jgi:hypothetical protein
MEVWKDIIGYDGLYQVSNFGNVRSLDRLIDGRNGRFYMRKGSNLSTNTSGNNYVHVLLRINNKSKPFSVHRLVASHFIDNADNLPEVNHKDEIRKNNHVDNLEWCTRKYNVNYGTGIERRKNNTNYKEIAELKCKKVLQFDFLGNFIKAWRSISDASKGSGCSRESIGDSIKGSYKGLSLYVWRLAE